MKFSSQGNVLLEFVIFIPICLLVIAMALYTTADKIHIVKTKSQMIQDSSENISKDDFRPFSKGKITTEKIKLSKVLSFPENSKIVTLLDGAKDPENILNDISLFKEILIDIGVKEKLRAKISTGQ